MGLKTESGFTLFELMMVIAILAFLAASGVPALMEWRNAATLRGAINGLRGDLQMAKSVAIKQNVVVKTQFFQGGYTIATDSGQVIKDRQMPTGIVIDLSATTLADDDGDGSPDTSFNGRGIPIPGIAGDLGTVVVEGPSGSKAVSINTVGRIQMS